MRCFSTYIESYVEIQSGWNQRGGPLPSAFQGALGAFEAILCSEDVGTFGVEFDVAVQGANTLFIALQTHEIAAAIKVGRGVAGVHEMDLLVGGDGLLALVVDLEQEGEAKARLGIVGAKLR